MALKLGIRHWWMRHYVCQVDWFGGVLCLGMHLCLWDGGVWVVWVGSGKEAGSGWMGTWSEVVSWVSEGCGCVSYWVWVIVGIVKWLVRLCAATLGFGLWSGGKDIGIEFCVGVRGNTATPGLLLGSGGKWATLMWSVWSRGKLATLLGFVWIMGMVTAVVGNSCWSGKGFRLDANGSRRK